jgi:hypothetical protein
MAIEPIEKRIEDMTTPRIVTSTAPGITVSYPEDTPEPEMQNPVEELQPFATVAALGSVRSLTRGLKGKRAPADPNITPAVPEPDASGATGAAPKERIEPTLGEPAPTETPPIAQPSPVSEQRLSEQAAERTRMLESGETLASPSPTAMQQAAGAQVSPISTVPFDTNEMQATVRSASEAVLTTAPTMTVREMYERAIQIGTPESVANQIFRDLPLSSNVGDSQLAVNIAGLLKLHDDSAAKMDELFSQMAKGELTMAGRLELRQQMAYHDVLLSQVKGVQVDVARSMNVFKRFNAPLSSLAPTEMREILEQVGGDDALLQLANDYMRLNTRAGKNGVIQAGLGQRMRETWMYVYQSNLLTNPETHAYNAAASIGFGAMATVERLAAAGFGITRKAFNLYPGEPYHMQQSLAEMYGFFEGVMDGLQFASHAVRTGQKATAKGDVRVSPLSAERISNLPFRAGNVLAGTADIATSVAAGMPMPISPVLGGLSDFGKEFYRTPDLTNSWIGKIADGLGFVHSMSFRAIAAVDEGVGGIVARQNLYSEGWLRSNKAYDEAILKGATEAEAQQIAKDVFADLLYNRPKNIQASIEGARRQATLMENFSRENSVSDFFWKTDQFFNHILAKTYVPFAKTMLNLYSEGAARLPGLNVTSPRFWEEYNKGGKYRDLALTRVAMGTATVAGAAYLSMQNRCTGSGPTDYADLEVLESLGYQKYSCRFDTSEISEKNLNTLSQFAKITKGTGTLEGSVFVSYARFDPISQIFATGANIGDALKFHTGKPDDSEIMELVRAAAFATYEYQADQPIATFIGDILQVLRTRQEDDGEKVVQVFSRFAKQYMDYSFTGMPGVGFANSSFVAKLETLSDPTKRSTMADEMNVPQGFRQMQETRQRILGRIPGVSQGVPIARDNLGNEKVVQNRGLDNWVNWTPILRVNTGKSKKTYEVLAEINHGVNRPSSVWDGVALSATQYERFKELYGKEIKLDLGITNASGVDLGPMNLNEAIPAALDEFVRDASINGEVVMIGDKQKFVDALVSKYRKMAKIKMIGFDNEGSNDSDLMAFMENVGMPGSNIEFPDLARAMQKQKDYVRMIGR